MKFLAVNNVLFDPAKVVYLMQDEKDVNKVTILFDNGERLECKGAEAAQMWKHFDEGGWRETPDQN